MLLCFSLILAVPIGVFWIECMAALLPDRSVSNLTPSPHSRPRIAVLIPAHNEAAVIAQTIASIQPQLQPTDRAIVIADNCTDDTAKIARQCGAIVLERQNDLLRGKGYALDFGLRYLEANPPEVVVCVDGDCIVAAGTIDRIARLAAAKNRPVQSAYVMETPEHPGVKDTISALAIRVKNRVRPRGLSQLGLPCLLTGSGMAFPWSVIRQISLASSATADDMQSALDLAVAGTPPLFCPGTRVVGRLMSQDAARSQRRRWEHGHLELLLTRVPQLIVAAAQQQRGDLLAIALDLCVPPLSLLVAMWTVATLCAVVVGALGVSWMPLWAFGGQGILLLAAILTAWAKFARADVSLHKLLAVPFYILGKLPLYFEFLIKPQTQWNHTERDVPLTEGLKV